MAAITELALAAVEWTAADVMSPDDVGVPWWEWMMERGSLTQRLRERCDPSVRVEVIDQRECVLAEDVAQLLGDERGSPCLVREVLLVAADQPRIFACTVIPEQTSSEHPWLSCLGEQPLGDALFTAADMVRGPIEVAKLSAGDALHARAEFATADGLENIWCRRSIYRLKGSPLLVCECFLPEIASCRTD